MVRCLLSAFLGMLLVPASAAPAAENAVQFEEAVQPFFGKYCLRCHGAKKQEGKLRLDKLSRDFSDEGVAQLWAEVMFRINSGEMPPRKQPQPQPGELGQVADWISSRISEGRAARMARRGPVSLYRLSRKEYANVVYDLLGVHFDVRMPGALNEDPRWHGFDRIGSILSLSPSHVARYFSAAETVLDQAFPRRVAKSTKRRHAAEAPGRWLILPGLRRGNINVRDAGLYRIRVRLSALPSFRGRLPRLSIWNNSLKRSETGLDVLAAEEEPTVVELEIFLPRGGFQLTNEAPGKLDDGPTIRSTPTTVTRLADYEIAPNGYKLFTDEMKRRPIFPLLLVDWIEYEGPILTEADQGKRQGLFPAGKLSRPPADPKQAEDLLKEARESLRRLVARAWRRPPADAEIDPYMKVLQSELDSGESFRAAYLSAATGVLTSKNFYYIVEGSPGERRDRINDWELASRLSFFLWSSTPDAELFELAGKGELHKRGVLKAQLHRMLADRKARRFTDEFPQQWLQLHKLGMFPPDPELYPDYDNWLEQSMIRETTGFFGEVFEKNLPIREFLSSSWTVINSRLGLHYGIKTPARGGFHRVALGAGGRRGGILTNASVLSLTSDGTRHRPVHRGVWVSESVFGKTPPPPPPNVEPLEPTPTDKPKATIRDQLEAHATHATCASCHRHIDPLGFAFDNYDAIGRWRTTEKVAGGQGADPAINADGVLPDGRVYSGPDEFKQLLVRDIDRFAEAFAGQLATFALRRVMTVDDTRHLRSIVAEVKPDGYRLQSLVRGLVMSDLFQER